MYDHSQPRHEKVYVLENVSQLNPEEMSVITIIIMFFQKKWGYK